MVLLDVLRLLVCQHKVPHVPRLQVAEGRRSLAVGPPSPPQCSGSHSSFWCQCQCPDTCHPRAMLSSSATSCSLAVRIVRSRKYQSSFVRSSGWLTTISRSSLSIQAHGWGDSLPGMDLIVYPHCIFSAPSRAGH